MTLHTKGDIETVAALSQPHQKDVSIPIDLLPIRCAPANLIHRVSAAAFSCNEQRRLRQAELALSPGEDLFRSSADWLHRL